MFWLDGMMLMMMLGISWSGGAVRHPLKAAAMAWGQQRKYLEPSSLAVSLSLSCFH
jgi:hypothetical protein